MSNLIRVFCDLEGFDVFIGVSILLVQIWEHLSQKMPFQSLMLFRKTGLDDLGVKRLILPIIWKIAWLSKNMQGCKNYFLIKGNIFLSDGLTDSTLRNLSIF